MWSAPSATPKSFSLMRRQQDEDEASVMKTTQNHENPSSLPTMSNQLSPVFKSNILSSSNLIPTLLCCFSLHVSWHLHYLPALAFSWMLVSFCVVLGDDWQTHFSPEDVLHQRVECLIRWEKHKGLWSFHDCFSPVSWSELVLVFPPSLSSLLFSPLCFSLSLVYLSLLLVLVFQNIIISCFLVFFSLLISDSLFASFCVLSSFFKDSCLCSLTELWVLFFGQHKHNTITFPGFFLSSNISWWES